MKRSSMVSVFLVSLAASALCACDDDTPSIKHCVDKATGTVVPERFCGGNIPDASTMTVEERTYYNTVIVPAGPAYHPFYLWHYDPVFVPIGHRVWTGGYAPAPGRVYYTPSAWRSSGASLSVGSRPSPSYAPGRSSGSVSRGGFGSVGRSFSASASS